MPSQKGAAVSSGGGPGGPPNFPGGKLNPNPQWPFWMAPVIAGAVPAGALTVTASDSLGATDSAARAALSLARTTADSLGASDVASRAALNLTRTATDAQGATDAAPRAAISRTRTGTDALGASDTATRVVLLPRTATDSLGMSDAAGALGPFSQTVLPDADIDATGWAVAPLFSKVNDFNDATLITAVCA